MEIKFGKIGEILFVTERYFQQVNGQETVFFNCLIYNFGNSVKVHFGNPKL